MAGQVIGGSNSFGATSPTSMFGNPNTFTAAADTQGSDYDRIMAQYDQLAKSPSGISPINPGSIGPSSATTTQASAAQVNPGQFPNISTTPVNWNPLTPQTATYDQSKDVTQSLAGLSDLATTGGYSEADKQDIRARDISPTRSIYANAQQNAERAKALGGGYSPNFNATQASMARDESSQIADINTNANAGIAQNVAANKIAATPAYASAAASANAAKTAADQRNADIVNQINTLNAQGTTQANEFNTQEKAQTDQFNKSMTDAIAEANANRATSASALNAQMGLGASEFNASDAANTQRFNTQNAIGTSEFNTQAALDAARLKQGAIGGQASLYGTTPALTNLFGNQVMGAAQLAQNQQGLDQQRFRTMAG